jgi:hypothetical protein
MTQAILETLCKKYKELTAFLAKTTMLSEIEQWQKLSASECTKGATAQ